MNFFNDVYKILLPEREVKQISLNNKILWQKAKIYGVSWTGADTAAMTRTDDSAAFASPVIGTGTTAGSSPFDNCYPWSEMTKETIAGGVYVKIPKFWYKWTKSGSAMTLQIADKPVPGFYVSPMHADRGDGNGERDIVYLARYKCDSDYKSTTGITPIGTITIGTARSNIAALGTGYYQQDYAAMWTLRMLFLVEWATWDGQSVIQNTSNYSSYSDIRTGNTDSMTYHTGVSVNGYGTQYRYIEDPWENTLEWIDGIYYDTSNVYCINNPKKFAIGSNGTKIGSRLTTTSGHVKSWTIPTASGFEWALLPQSVHSSEGYTKDGYYYVSTGTCLYTGGARNSAAVHGPWFMYTDYTASSTSYSISARGMYLP